MSMRPRMIAGFLVILAVSGCGGGEDVTVRSLANARRTWDAANVRDYDLEWTAAGARDAHYLVYVRGGQVKSIRATIRDNRTGEMRQIEAKPADPSYYGVEGLFKILEEERSQLLEERPFGHPKNTQVLLKFTPDPKLGYPTRYRRDVVGSPKGLALDVVRFVPNATEAIPPPPS